MMFNAHHEPLEFTLPTRNGASGGPWCSNTAGEKDLLAEQETGAEIAAGGTFQVQPWSLVLLRSVSPS